MSSKKYESKFGAFNDDDKITDGNKICEKIFQKRAEKNNEGKLPDKFWKMAKYKGPYTGQIVAANRLLKKYSMLAICRALDSKEAKYILSLTNKKLIPIIEKMQSQIKDSVFEESKKEDILPKRKKTGKKNLWSQL